MGAASASESSQRVVALGRLALSYGLGGVVGPIVGGFVVHTTGASSAVAVAAAMEMPLVVLLMATIVGMKGRVVSSGDRSRPHDVLNLPHCMEIFRVPSVSYLLTV